MISETLNGTTGLHDGTPIWTAQVVSDYLIRHAVSAEDLPTLIKNVATALADVSNSAADIPDSAITSRPIPAVPIGESVHPYIVCLENGMKKKVLKRSLKRICGLSPEQYRAKWGLPDDYPTTAPNYSDKRRSLASWGALKPGPGRARIKNTS